MKTLPTDREAMEKFMNCARRAQDNLLKWKENIGYGDEAAADFAMSVVRGVLMVRDWADIGDAGEDFVKEVIEMVSQWYNDGSPAVEAHRCNSRSGKGSRDSTTSQQ